MAVLELLIYLRTKRLIEQEMNRNWLCIFQSFKRIGENITNVTQKVEGQQHKMFHHSGH